VQHLIRQYSLEAGSLEIEYMEQYFGEFARPKTTAELLARLSGRDHLILISLAPSLEDGDHLVPVAFKVGHELRREESDPAVADLVARLRGCVSFERHRIFYSWLGGTRSQWRGQGHYRALTEQQEDWAQTRGYHEFAVKTKNRFYGMRAVLDRLQFNVVKFEPDTTDNTNSKLYLSKPISADLVRSHMTSRQVSHAG